MGSKQSNFQCNSKSYTVDKFFQDLPASKWSFEAYINDIINNSEFDLGFDQLLTNFTESLETMNKLNVVPLSVRSFCASYIKWLQVLLPLSFAFIDTGVEFTS